MEQNKKSNRNRFQLEWTGERRLRNQPFRKEETNKPRINIVVCSDLQKGYILKSIYGF